MIWRIENESERRQRTNRRDKTHVLEEDLQNTTGLFVDKTRDTLDTTTTGKTTNSGLCDTLDVVTKDFTMTLGTTLSETLIM